MNRLLFISPEAEAEVGEAREWYDARADGLAAAFMRAVDACFAMIEREPEAFPVVHRDLRRALLRRFQYAVIYRVLEGEILIVACIHTSRDPERWQSRD